MSNAETRVLLTVLRHTYGWNKKSDRISLSQFESETGMDRKSVCRAIKSLLNKKIVINEKTDITSYSFNKNKESWVLGSGRTATSGNLASGRIATRGSGNLAKKVVAKQPPTKDIITKDNIKTEREQSSPQALFIKSFSGFYEKATGCPFNADRKHFVMVANLIKKHGLPEVINKTTMLAEHCQRADVWFTREGWSCFTPETLRAHWNRIVPIMSEEEKQRIKDRLAYEKATEDRRKADELLKNYAVAARN